MADRNRSVRRKSRDAVPRSSRSSVARRAPSSPGAIWRSRDAAARPTRDIDEKIEELTYRGELRITLVDESRVVHNGE